MRIDALDLYLIKMSMVGEFVTSFGAVQEREIVLVRAHAGGASGWGESGVDGVPLYSYEDAATCWHIIEDFLAPVILAHDWPSGGLGPAMADLFSSWRWHPMARAAVEEALWDLEANLQGVSVRQLYAGERESRERIPVGISLGIQDNFDLLAAQISEALDQGYQRIKLKIEPGKDIGVIEKVRHQFGEIPLMVDGNCGYTREQGPILKGLDPFNLLMIEQPLAQDDIPGHADLQAEMKTPICLDESIHSLRHARLALDYDACRLINIKASRVGGRTEGIAIHDLCADRGVPVWCGGMLESGIGRLHNIAMASLPNFQMPGDLSASRRYWHEDIIDPEVTVESDGHVEVPDTVGLGHRVREDAIQRLVVRSTSLTRE